jgi:hypothetical protein
MADFFSLVASELAERASGPMKFRLILQPLMASAFAIMSGIKDARTGRPAYFWGLLTADRPQRREMLKDGWKSVGTVFLIALVLDGVYQVIVDGGVRVGETIVVAFILAIIPYLLLRGLVTRIARRMPKPSQPAS